MYVDRFTAIDAEEVILLAQVTTDTSTAEEV